MWRYRVPFSPSPCDKYACLEPLSMQVFSCCFFGARCVVRAWCNPPDPCGFFPWKMALTAHVARRLAPPLQNHDHGPTTDVPAPPLLQHSLQHQTSVRLLAPKSPVFMRPSHRSPSHSWLSCFRVGRRPPAAVLCTRTRPRRAAFLGLSPLAWAGMAVRMPAKV